MLTLNTGVTFSAPNQFTRGLVLIAPIGGSQVQLINYKGEVVHEWQVGNGFTNWCYLLPNGNLFINERCDNRKGVALTGSGLMREYDWDGNLVWEHLDPYQHHDARKLPQGGAAYLAFTELTPSEAAQVKGGVPHSESPGGLYGEAGRVVDENGALVWQWDFAQLDNDKFPLHANANRWSRGHTNTVCPLDDGTYLISCKVLNLIFIVDPKTDKIIWHKQDVIMSGQHDAQQLENGNILVFANGVYSSDLHFSQVLEIDPATKEIAWAYKAKDNPQGFFSPHIGGAQRLASGNTLICEGAKGCLFEVTPEGDVVWEYVCPQMVDVPGFGEINWLFRARHYLEDSQEIQGRVKA